jgi:CO/xanthine dehydrogenase FAD-binding subunit
MRFNYCRATNVEEALQMIEGEATKLIAGGTDILVRIQEHLEAPSVLVDIGSLDEMAQINEKDGFVEVGALVTHAQSARSPLLQEKGRLLVQGCREVGSPQVRSRGTIGGNIVTASPAGDAIPPLFCLGAILKLRSRKGEREVPIEAFFAGVKKTVLRPDELLVSIRFPSPKKEERVCFLKLGQRKSMAITKVSVAACIEVRDGIVRNARIALGAVASTVIRAPRAEEYLRGQKLCEGMIPEAVQVVKKESRAIDDIRSNADYRNEMTGILLGRGLSRILEQSQHST